MAGFPKTPRKAHSGRRAHDVFAAVTRCWILNDSPTAKPVLLAVYESGSGRWAGVRRQKRSSVMCLAGVSTAGRETIAPWRVHSANVGDERMSIDSGPHVERSCAGCGTVVLKGREKPAGRRPVQG